jgi:hypothetical protein
MARPGHGFVLRFAGEGAGRDEDALVGRPKDLSTSTIGTKYLMKSGPAAARSIVFFIDTDYHEHSGLATGFEAGAGTASG